VTLLKVGLTGGIASGKSTVGEMLARRGAHLLQADEIAHRLMQPGQPVYEAVVREFGREILDGDGNIDRQKLAAEAFGGTGRTARVNELNRIVHPAVIRRQEAWMEEVGRRDPHAIAIIEAALIFEAGVASHFDKIVLVTCRPEQRAPRLASRLKLDIRAAEGEVARRVAAQMPDNEKAKAADFVVDNSGTRAQTEQQVEQILRELRKSA
jgi:dephospho-CoA kinase